MDKLLSDRAVDSLPMPCAAAMAPNRARRGGAVGTPVACQVALANLSKIECSGSSGGQLCSRGVSDLKMSIVCRLTGKWVINFELGRTVVDLPDTTNLCSPCIRGSTLLPYTLWLESAHAFFATSHTETGNV